MYEEKKGWSGGKAQAVVGGLTEPLAEESGFYFRAPAGLRVASSGFSTAQAKMRAEGRHRERKTWQ